jgi:hypothetical protein
LLLADLLPRASVTPARPRGRSVSLQRERDKTATNYCDAKIADLAELILSILFNPRTYLIQSPALISREIGPICWGQAHQRVYPPRKPITPFFTQNC